jgi:hypothetical protein
MGWTAAVVLSVEEAVLALLRNPEWAEWSDREIASRCGVTHPFVAKLRPPQPVTVIGLQLDPERLPDVRTYREKHGNTTTMNTAGINANRAPAAMNMGQLWAFKPGRTRRPSRKRRCRSACGCHLHCCPRISAPETLMLASVLVAKHHAKGQA